MWDIESMEKLVTVKGVFNKPQWHTGRLFTDFNGSHLCYDFANKKYETAVKYA